MKLETEEKSMQLDPLFMRCATCKYWQGDKEKAIQMFKEDQRSMDLLYGWPNDGCCSIAYEWLNTEINGNALVENTVDANFGCVYWSV